MDVWVQKVYHVSGLEEKFYEESSWGTAHTPSVGESKVLCPTDASVNQMDAQYGNVVNNDLMYDFNDLM